MFMKRIPALFLILFLLLSSHIAAELTIDLAEERSLATADGQEMSILTLGTYQMSQVLVSDINGSADLEIEPSFSEDVDESTSLKIVGKLLNYPNPFSISKGSTTIGYELSKEANISFELYSMSGYLLYASDFIAGDEGGNDDYNRILINRAALSPAILSPGVYIYVIRTESKVLGKNKMVVLP
jgi:hypothetical protein